MLDIGFKNYIDSKRIVAVFPTNSSKSKWLIKEAILSRKLINCTHGKKASSILILNTDHLVLSPLKHSSILKRLK